MELSIVCNDVEISQNLDGLEIALSGVDDASDCDGLAKLDSVCQAVLHNVDVDTIINNVDHHELAIALATEINLADHAEVDELVSKVGMHHLDALVNQYAFSLVNWHADKLLEYIDINCIINKFDRDAILVALGFSEGPVSSPSTTINNPLKSIKLADL